MKTDYAIETVRNNTMGVTPVKNGISVKAVLGGKESNGIILYDDNTGETCQIDFPDSCRIGKVYSAIRLGSYPFCLPNIPLRLF